MHSVYTPCTANRPRNRVKNLAQAAPLRIPDDAIRLRRAEPRLLSRMHLRCPARLPEFRPAMPHTASWNPDAMLALHMRQHCDPTLSATQKEGPRQQTCWPRPTQQRMLQMALFQLPSSMRATASSAPFGSPSPFFMLTNSTLFFVSSARLFGWVGTDQLATCW